MEKRTGQNRPRKIVLGIAIGLGALALLLWACALVLFFRAGGSVLAIKSPQIFFIELIAGGILAVAASVLLFVYSAEQERYRRAAVKTVVCPSCGKRVPEAFGFCPNCGEKLKTKDE